MCGITPPPAIVALISISEKIDEKLIEIITAGILLILKGSGNKLLFGK